MIQIAAMMALSALVAFGVAVWVLRRPFPLNSEVVDRLLGSACYSPARIERELDWRAKMGLAEGVREMLA